MVCIINIIHEWYTNNFSKLYIMQNNQVSHHIKLLLTITVFEYII